MTRWGLLSVAFVCTGFAGCGGCDDRKVGRLPDAPPPIDAVDAADLPVTVTVTLAGAPVKDQIVYFQQPDSTMVAQQRTGTDGKASARVQAGGYVTVIEPEPVPDPGRFEVPTISTRLATFAGVKPGDDLHLDIQPVSPNVTDVTFDLTVPNEGLGHTYTLYSSCGQYPIGTDPIPAITSRAGAQAAAATMTATVTLSGCNGTADLLVVSTDSDGKLTGWQYHPNKAVASGVAVALTGDYQAGTDFGFNYSNVPPAVDSLSVYRELRSARGSLYISDQRTATRDADTATAAATITLPDPAGLKAITTTNEQPGAGSGQQTIIEWGATGAYALDHGAIALRRYQDRPSLDAANHAIVWTEMAGGAVPAFLFGQIQASRPDGGYLQQWTWRIVAPYTSTKPQLTYPTLPAGSFDYNVKATDESSVEQLTAVLPPGGYDAVRPRAFNEQLPDYPGASGRIVAENMFTVIDERRSRTPDPRSLSPQRFTPNAR